MRFLAALLLFAAACSPTIHPDAEQRRPGGTRAPAQTVPSKPLVIASSFEPATLEATFGVGSGNRDFGTMVNGYLVHIDSPYKPVAYLAAELPSLESGTWKLLPNGRMETLYKLRPNLRFHDGHPITAGDFAFAFQVRTDPEVVAPSAEAEGYVSAVRVVDDSTMVMEWRQAYPWAGEITAPSFSPMPRHLLEPVYRSGANSFTEGPQWRDAFVGSGPYRLESWEPGVEMVLRAFDDFALGRPGVDEITVRFTTDASGVVADLLSGAADIAFGATIGYPQAEGLLQTNWWGGVDFFPGPARYLQFQMRDWGNLQRAVLDVRVRQAMLHAIDRQALVDTVYAGRARALQVWLYPADPSYGRVEREVAKYPFDLSRAQALLEEAGWRRGADGVLRSAAGEPLDMPVLAFAGRIEEQETEVIASAWRSLGMPLDVSWLTPAQVRNGEYRSKYPAVAYDRRTLGYDSMVWTSGNLSGPQNRWILPNRNGYVNPRLDDLWARVMGTPAFREREGYLVDAMKVMADDAVVVPTHLQPRVVAYPADLTGVKEPPTPAATITSPWEWRWQ